jgi:hypothetical protein
MVLKFVSCAVIEIIDFYSFKWLMQKTYLFSMQSGMLQANALKSIGYTDRVLFLTIGKPDIYQHKSLDKLATAFYPCDQKLPEFAAGLPNLFCDRYPAYQYLAKVLSPHY